MEALTLLAVTPAFCVLCALVGWIYWLRLIRHVHDRSGAEAIRTLAMAALVYLGTCGVQRVFRRR